MIAKEAAAPFQTYSGQEAVKAFVQSHRLTIANAFERKLVRKDVVAELSALYEKSKDDDPILVINSGG